MNFGYNLLTDCKLSTFAKNILNFYRPHLPEVRIRGVMPCHRMAHCVLIRCFLQTEPRRGSTLVSSSLETISDWVTSAYRKIITAACLLHTLKKSSFTCCPEYF